MIKSELPEISYKVAILTYPYSSICSPGMQLRTVNTHTRQFRLQSVIGDYSRQSTIGRERDSLLTMSRTIGLPGFTHFQLKLTTRTVQF